MVKPTLINWFSLITLGFIWGASFMSSKLALVDFAPITVSAFRIVIAAFVLTIIAYLYDNGLPRFNTAINRRIWLHCLGMGIFSGALPYSLLNWGQQYVTSSFAGICMTIVPLFVLPLTHFLVSGEFLTMRKLVGFIIGFIGCIVLIKPENMLISSGESLEPIARFACIAAAVSYAIGVIITRLCPPVSTISYSASGLLLGAIFCLPIAILIDGTPNPANIGITAIMSVIFLGLFPTAIATLLKVSITRSAGAGFFSLVNYQVPLWAVILGVALLGESLPAQFITALALIFIGLAISSLYLPSFTKT